MTEKDYQRQMKQICDYVRRLEGKVMQLQTEVEALKRKGQKPIKDLTDEDKQNIVNALYYDKYCNQATMPSNVAFKRNICYISFSPSNNPASDKQITLGVRMLSSRSQLNGMNKFLLGKIIDVMKQYDLSKVQMICLPV